MIPIILQSSSVRPVVDVVLPTILDLSVVHLKKAGYAHIPVISINLSGLEGKSWI